ncbi:MAG: ABC transporter ATP-binding protein, partial [Deltaproteobacteria bacterium]|nr:ABC transporter ATP-binding protein [Deltaproteobacteria bacterium]
GKTTVFNLVTGIYQPDAGSMELEGENLVGNKPHRINRLGIARTFQNIRLFRNLTVMDNVRIAHHSHLEYGPLAALCRTERFYNGEKELQGKVEEFLSIFMLHNRKYEMAGSLSYGDQRRLEIARALASEPRVLLLDEPAAGMNPYEVGKLMEFILAIQEKFRLSILLIEHQMRVVMGICERLAVMDFGQVIARGIPSEIRENRKVIEAYLGEDITIE